MAAGSSNEFPKVLIKEGSAPASPASGDQALFIDSADHKLKRKNSSGTVTTVEGAGTMGGSSGSTDNAVIRADGTGGSTIQSSAATIDDSGTIDIPTGQTYNINGSPHTHAGSGLTLQYPALKPGTPTYDFDGASLSGDFSAHSSQGSFATTDCIQQFPLGVPGSTLAMMFNAQMGGLYVSHSNGDLDFHIGMLQLQSMASTARMMGIAALDSSGNGVAVIVYTDNSVYLAAISGWNYASNSDNWSGRGMGGITTLSPSMPYWLRLKRISGTWTGYASLSGKAWDKTFSTRSDSVTVDRLFFGLLYNTSDSYHGILTADYFHVAT